uniref:Uncharacterized protein n=1 Tax=Knipowitschia caucasica TaxID=637954 RepID=A0AAV2JBG2_KNICA
MYVVLVHSPDNKKYENDPLLEESENCICAYIKADRNFHFIWRPQAMSETHNFRLMENEGGVSAEKCVYQHYVWDHATLALDVGDKVLQLPDLHKSVRFCEKNKRPINKQRSFQSFENAKAIVQKLWPESGPLQEFKESAFHIND